jgi:hypothetical protein
MGITRDTWIWDDVPMNDFRRERELDALEARIEAHNRNYEWHQQNNAYLAKERAKVLAMPLPRNTCPGCFCAIYDLAAKDGWCLDCDPNEASPSDINSEVK